MRRKGEEEAWRWTKEIYSNVSKRVLHELITNYKKIRSCGYKLRGKENFNGFNTENRSIILLQWKSCCKTLCLYMDTGLKCWLNSKREEKQQKRVSSGWSQHTGRMVDRKYNKPVVEFYVHVNAHRNKYLCDKTKLMH